MQAVKAIYDGKEFKTLEPIPVKGRYVVAITFIEPVDNGQQDLLKYENIFNDDDVARSYPITNSSGLLH